YGIFKQSEAALGLVMLYTLGFIVGRVSGIVVDGEPNEFVYTWLITEIVSFLIAAFLFIRKTTLATQHAESLQTRNPA
ncbi:MAG TPA: DUF4345 family protein, partial [Cyclobacteriaceae bacterium]